MTKMTNMGNMGNMGKTTKMGKMGNMWKIGNMGNMGNMGKTLAVGRSVWSVGLVGRSHTRSVGQPFARDTVARRVARALQTSNVRAREGT